MRIKHILIGSKNTKASNVSVFSAHVIGYDYYLEHVRIDRLSEAELSNVYSNGGLQSVSIFICFGIDVKGDPAVWLVESDNSDILKITRTSSSTYSESRRGVRVILGVTEIYGQLLQIVR